MSLGYINWEKPKKVRTTEEHNKTFSSDCEADGTYVPNMSKEDARMWKGKHINKGKRNARVELRKTFDQCDSYAQVLIVVPKEGFNPEKTLSHNGNIRISTNGKIEMTFADMRIMNNVIEEARLMIAIAQTIAIAQDRKNG